MKYRIIETLIMLVFGGCLLGYVALWVTHPVLAAIITTIEVAGLLIWRIMKERENKKVYVDGKKNLCKRNKKPL